jgi:peptidoglycan hydrolase-like protein with peptidoglycan-binding domain
MTLKRTSSVLLAGAASLALMVGCAPVQQQIAAPAPVSASEWPSADIPISDLDKAEIQASLNKLGYEAGAVDGFVGRQSREAIRGFQADIGVSPTGYYSPLLLDRLRDEAGKVAITGKPEAVLAPMAAKPVTAKPVTAKPVAARPVAAAAVAASAAAAPAPAPAVVVAAPAPVIAAPEPVFVFEPDEGGDGGGGGGGGGGW